MCVFFLFFISAYEKAYFGHTAEERLLDITRRARIGPAEGEPGVTRVESSTSNGVQVITGNAKIKNQRNQNHQH